MTDLFVCPFDDGVGFVLRVTCGEQDYDLRPAIGIIELHAFARGEDFWEWLRQECAAFGPPNGPWPSFEECQAAIPESVRPTAKEISRVCGLYLEEGWKNFVPGWDNGLKPSVPFDEDDAVVELIKEKGIRLEVIGAKGGHCLLASGGTEEECRVVTAWLEEHNLRVVTLKTSVPGLHGADLTDYVLRQAQPIEASVR